MELKYTCDKFMNKYILINNYVYSGNRTSQQSILYESQNDSSEREVASPKTFFNSCSFFKEIERTIV